MQTIIEDVSRLIGVGASIGWECWEHPSNYIPEDWSTSEEFKSAELCARISGVSEIGRTRFHLIWCNREDEKHLRVLLDSIDEWMGAPPYAIETPITFSCYCERILVRGRETPGWKLARLLDKLFESIPERLHVISRKTEKIETSMEGTFRRDVLRAIRAYLTEPTKSDGKLAATYTPSLPILPLSGIEAARWWEKRTEKPKLTDAQSELVQRVIAAYDQGNEGVTAEVLGERLLLGPKRDVTVSRMCERINKNVKKSFESGECMHFFRIYLSKNKRVLIDGLIQDPTEE